MRRLDPSVDVEADGSATCPYCGSEETIREHPRGPSLCKSIHYCNSCEESFEKMG